MILERKPNCDRFVARMRNGLKAMKHVINKLLLVIIATTYVTC